MKFVSLASSLLAAGAITLTASTSKAAGSNEGPPQNAILDLNGQTVPHSSAQDYSVSFTASVSNTAITFAFREDPSFLDFSDAEVVDETAANGVNLLQNGDFSGGTQTSNGNSKAPVDWTYSNQYGAASGGTVSSSCEGGFSTCWTDGAIQAYDAISQTIPTTIGDAYRISFAVTDRGGLTTFSDLSTNGDTADSGGNGVDITAYAQLGLPAPAVSGAPEPATWALMILGVGMVGAGLRFNRRRAAALVFA